MLNPANRLTKMRDFNLLMKTGRWVRGSVLDLCYLPLGKAGDFFPLPKNVDPDSFKKQLRLAIAAGLKVSKKAVERNRAKRQVREVLRLLLKGKKIRPGYYILVSTKKGIIGKDYAEISQEIELLLSKANLLL